ncbi:MAG: hypothetical protein ACPGXL_09720 [Chitinophagales bacterium]
MIFRHFSPWTVTISMLLTMFVFGACEQSKAPDVSHIEVDTEIHRFDKELFAIDTVNYRQQIDVLQEKYPDFFPLFTNQLMGFGAVQNPEKNYQKEISTFTINKDMLGLYDSVQIRYNDLSPIKEAFEQAFRYSKYYFPNKSLPKLVSYIGVFNPAALTIEGKQTVLAMNLDMYLGKNYPFYYPPEEFPVFLRKRFYAPYIVPNSLKAWAKAEYKLSKQENKLLDQMIYEGKILYFLDLLLPETADALKIGYSAAELTWCKNNEFMVWEHLTPMLIDAKGIEFKPLLNEAPFTKGMPRNSPGRTPIWIGWQIVKKYMAQHPETTFDQLLQIKDGRQLLQASKYKPKPN